MNIEYIQSKIWKERESSLYMCVNGSLVLERGAIYVPIKLKDSLST